MPRPLRAVISPEAVAEIARIVVWWQEHRPSAPRLFQTELESALLRIVDQPEIGARAKARNARAPRAVVLRRTGYVVFCDVDEAA